MKAKDEQIADALRAKDRELNDTIKTLTESMRAMEREMNAMRSSPTVAGGRGVAGPGAPTIADIAL